LSIEHLLLIIAGSSFAKASANKEEKSRNAITQKETKGTKASHGRGAKPVPLCAGLTRAQDSLRIEDRAFAIDHCRAAPSERSRSIRIMITITITITTRTSSGSWSECARWRSRSLSKFGPSSSASHSDWGDRYTSGIDGQAQSRSQRDYTEGNEGNEGPNRSPCAQA
jgi:hypothetical protein